MKDFVQQAETFAREIHLHQKRHFGNDKGKPYIVHPERVQANFDDPFLKAVSWLHDVVEDSDCTLDDLKEKGFPIEVIHGVNGMTRREGESYHKYIVRVKVNQFALPVKIADIKDNLKSLPSNKKVMRDKYELALYILMVKQICS